MDLDVVFLGTSGSMPTAQRAAAAMLVRRGGERLLIDCAEGTQRQLLRSDVGLVELREIFLTHYHADHFLGLPGMLKTFALRGRETSLTVYGPPGLEELFASLRRIFGRLTYPLELVELRPGDVLERDGYRLEAFPVEHGGAAFGYALIEDERPGRFDVAGADALGVPNGPERGALQHGEPVTLADGRVVSPEDVLGPARPGARSSSRATRRRATRCSRPPSARTCSCTRRRSASTSASGRGRRCTRPAADAAEIARRAEVGLLALTHLSTRYAPSEVAAEARAVFPDTIVPRDFDLVEVPFRERGTPQLVKGGALHHPPEAVSSSAE